MENFDYYGFSSEIQNSSVNCTSDVPSSGQLKAFAYITIVSSSASILGSSLIILTYLMWRDIRTVARTIVVFLAVADLLTALGYLLGAVVFIHFRPEYSNVNTSSTYRKFCEAQSFITTVFPISSFLWTSHLAIYLFVTITLQKNQLAKRLGIFFHVTAWGIPLLACIPALIANQLGNGSSRTSITWCFIRYNSTYPGSQSEYRQRLAKYYGFELLCGKFWEIMTYVIALVLYVIVKISIYRQKKAPNVSKSFSYGSLNMDKRVIAAIIQIDQKLIWIPIVFILLRLGGTIRFFISFTPSCHHPCPHDSPSKIIVMEHCADALYAPFLMGLQSVGDAAQGWGNALLFVIFNKTIAKRLFPCFFTLREKAKKFLAAHTANCDFDCCSCCYRKSYIINKESEGDSTSQDRLALLRSTSRSENVSSASYDAAGKTTTKESQRIAQVENDSSYGSERTSDREK